jgi:hypothetical protein
MSQQDSLIAPDDEVNDISNAEQAGLFGGERDTDSTTHAASRDTAKPKAQSQRQPRSKVASNPSQELLGEDDEPQDDPMRFIQTKDLPPLPGNVQMYVRISIQGQPDYDNVRNYHSRGWRPRTRDTVPEGYAVGSRQVVFDELDFGNVVCNRDRILMERPRAMHEREQAWEKAQQNDISDQIKGMMRNNEQFGLASHVEVAKSGTVQDGLFRF